MGLELCFVVHQNPHWQIKMIYHPQSERYSFYAVGSTSISREIQIVSNLPALAKAPTVPLFSVMPAKFPVLWLAKRIVLLAVDVESNPGLTLVCSARPHAGAGASAHVLNHTTSHNTHTSKQHKTRTNTQKHATQPNQNTASNRHVHTTSKHQLDSQINKRSLHTQPDIITKLTTTSKTSKITNYTPIRTDREVKRRTTHIHWKQHNIHPLRHPKKHQHTQNRTTVGQDPHKQKHKQEQTLHRSKPIHTTTRHNMTTLRNTRHRHNILHRTHYQHNRLHTYR